MNEKEEIIEMLEILRDSGINDYNCDTKSSQGDWITVLKGIKHSSFEFVINKAIEYIKGMNI
jgi:hypothetical protein